MGRGSKMTEDLFEFAARRAEPEPAPKPDPAQATMQFLLSLRERGIANLAVLRAMETLPREQFVPHRHADLAWRDIALPIACGQTMPEPFLVARMVESLNLLGAHRVLEIGTGSGYMAALAAHQAASVLSLEIDSNLAQQARANLQAAGIANVEVRNTDGCQGAPADGPFDVIFLSGSVPEVPQALLQQLKTGGRLRSEEHTSELQSH